MSLAGKPNIGQGRAAAELEAVRGLFRAYLDELGVDLDFQGFTAELSGLPGAYAPPEGALLVARWEDRVVGCVALRAIDGGACEMKRLYVPPTMRGTGLGRDLAIAVLEVARRRGYLRMRLDTLDRLEEAMGLYASLGFRPTTPYYDNPLPGVVYWELDLTQDAG